MIYTERNLTKKNRHLEATSRSIIIQGTQALREKFGGSFRSYRQATLEVKEAKTIYNKKQDEIAGQKMTLKKTSNMKID